MRSMFGVLTNEWPAQASALNRKSSIRMNRKLGRWFCASRGAAKVPKASLLDNGIRFLFNHDAGWVELWLGKFHIQAVQRFDDDLGNRQIAEPFLVRWNDAPR